MDTEYNPAILVKVIKTCENLYVEEQNQLKILLQKYEHLFDRTLGEFNIDSIEISLWLINHNYKQVHARAYTVPRSVEHQLQQSMEILRLVKIRVIKKDNSYE
jgi:hypothetical protein